MKFLLTCMLLSFTATTYAQKETFDLIRFQPPSNWKKEIRETMAIYNIINNKDRTWCQIAIVKSTISKGTIEQDFESEWQELVVKNYNPTEGPGQHEIQEADGWKIQTGEGKFIFSNAPAMVMLTTISGFNRCVSIIATTNADVYFKDIVALLESAELIKPELPAAQLPVGNVNNNSVVGTWKATASGNSNYRVKNGVMDYISRQYAFHTNGTYQFTSRTFDPFMNKILIGNEKGTYQVADNIVTVIPSESVLEAWSKKDGADKLGTLLSSQKRVLEKTSYRFTMHYFSGVQSWSLVLQSDIKTERDGPYSNNNTFSNAWFYKPVASNNPAIEIPDGSQQSNDQHSNKPAANTVSGGFFFTTTNFDNGWTSTVQENWVQVIKGNMKVLIHYPDKSVDDYNPDLLGGLQHAWNVLVAPRYSNTGNLAFRPVSDWQSIEFAESNAIEKESGKTVYVVLFKKNYSNGSGKYVEFIMPDRQSFENEFGSYESAKANYGSSGGWDKMAEMANYNKFAVAASDLQGIWTNKFTGMQQYVNAYTGANAGMNTHASNETFEFGPGSTYKWNLGVASGFVGNIKFQSVKSNGNFTVPDNWHISFSDIEGKPRQYNASFSCIKGARILWIDGNAFGKAD